MDSRLDERLAVKRRPVGRTCHAVSASLVIACGPRNDGTCPGEISKTWRLAQFASEALRAEAMQVDLLDLSLLTSDYERRIHPCKGCVVDRDAAVPLALQLLPQHALGQVGDWMAEIYERWVSAHGVLLLTPRTGIRSPAR